LVNEEHRKKIKDERWKCFTREEIAKSNDNLDVGLITDSTLTYSNDLGEPLDIIKSTKKDFDIIFGELDAIIKELNYGK
jgi:type I restriction enzyme M protein